MSGRPKNPPAPPRPKPEPKEPHACWCWRDDANGHCSACGWPESYHHNNQRPAAAETGCPWQAQCSAPDPNGPPFECPDCPRLVPAEVWLTLVLSNDGWEVTRAFRTEREARSHVAPKHGRWTVQRIPLHGQGG